MASPIFPDYQEKMKYADRQYGYATSPGIGGATVGLPEWMKFYTKPTRDDMVKLMTAIAEHTNKLNELHQKVTRTPEELVDQEIEIMTIQRSLSRGRQAYEQAKELYFHTDEQFKNWQVMNDIFPPEGDKLTTQLAADLSKEMSRPITPIRK